MSNSWSRLCFCRRSGRRVSGRPELRPQHTGHTPHSQALPPLFRALLPLSPLFGSTAFYRGDFLTKALLLLSAGFFRGDVLGVVSLEGVLTWWFGHHQFVHLTSSVQCTMSCSFLPCCYFPKNCLRIISSSSDWLCKENSSPFCLQSRRNFCLDP